MKLVKQWSALNRFRFVQLSTGVVTSVANVLVGVRVFVYLKEHGIITNARADLLPWEEFWMVLLISMSPAMVSAVASVSLWKRCLVLLGFTKEELEGYPFYWERPFPGVPGSVWRDK